MGKKALRLSVDLDTENMQVIFIVLDAADEEVMRQVFPLADVHETLRKRVWLYGLAGLYKDRTSGIKENPVAKIAGMAPYAAIFAKGIWDMPREKGPAVVPVKVEALARFRNWDIAETQIVLADYSDDQKAVIFKHPEVIRLIGVITEERKVRESVKGSLDDMLSPAPAQAE